MSFGTLPAAGSAILVLVSAWTSGGANVPASGVTDNQGNTYSRAIQSTPNTSAVAAILYALNIGTPSGTFTVTVNPDGAANWIEAVAIEVSGLAAAGALDQTATATGTSTTPVSGTTATTTQADELVVAAVEVDVNNTNVGLDVPATTGYTNLAVQQNASATIGHASDDKIVAATGTQTAAWGTLAGAFAWGGVIATFKGAAVPVTGGMRLPALGAA